MTLYTKEEILAEADKIATDLGELDEIKRFKELEKRLNDNKKVKHLIEKMKGVQKQAVNLQAYGKPEAVKHAESQIDEVQAEIDAIPIVEEFKASQVVVNDLLQSIIGTIGQHIPDKSNE